MFGFLNIDKPIGMTSHDVVAILRRVCKIKQIGHTGTLDPFAQGVLPICIGKSTRLIEYLDDEKEYLAFVNFGKSTNTYDLEGEATFETDLKTSQEQILVALEDFKGEIIQVPPIYSAIKVKGKKLYEYARAGESVEIEPRKVFIEKIELKEFDQETQIAQILIKCSKGTYIRSIAHDLGEKLGVGAHLSKLIRTQAGKFFIENAIALEDIKTLEDVQKNLIEPLFMLDLPTLEIDEDAHKKVLMGQFLPNKEFNEDEIIILVYNKENVSDKDSCHCEERSDEAIQIIDENRLLHPKGFAMTDKVLKISAIAQIKDNLIKVKKVLA